MCGRRAKAGRAEALRQLCQLRPLALECSARGKERAVVVQPVEADLEAPVDELPQDPGVNVVPAAEVEGRAQTVRLFEVGDLDGEAQPFGGLDVVRQDQRG